jgi:hypothetical protein
MRGPSTVRVGFWASPAKASTSEEKRLGTPVPSSATEGLSSSLGIGPRRSQMTERMSGGAWVAEAGRDVSSGLVKFTLLPKPRSNSSAACMVRSLAEGAPSTTVTRRRPLRLALATTLKPEEQMKPVFMPSAPG